MVGDHAFCIAFGSNEKRTMNKNSASSRMRAFQNGTLAQQKSVSYIKEGVSHDQSIVTDRNRASNL
jgi:hypothetical protein